jgi:hypothetical protein
VADELFDQVKLYLPKYLTPLAVKQLFEELREFPDNSNFYWHGTPPSELLQGDGWKGLVAIDFRTLEKKAVSGVILSNSCDIDISNPRGRAMNVLFVPLIRLSSYERLLASGGRTPEQIGDTLSSIRKQTVTYIFHLPDIPAIMDESIVLLDDIHAHPLADFLTCERSRIFSLTQSAFYVFLLKLSIHFSRFQEGFART